ncbi:hypothetical protein K438DRAFT_440673 [Mycena galopus ATCC 62051]|nr:hypothetical protein K438DRAFT_440673 [Mycena galopus ATCC 62051]
MYPNKRSTRSSASPRAPRRRPRSRPSCRRCCSSSPRATSGRWSCPPHPRLRAVRRTMPSAPAHIAPPRRRGAPPRAAAAPRPADLSHPMMATLSTPSAPHPYPYPYPESAKAAPSSTSPPCTPWKSAPSTSASPGSASAGSVNLSLHTSAPTLILCLARTEVPHNPLTHDILMPLDSTISCLLRALPSLCRGGCPRLSFPADNDDRPTTLLYPSIYRRPPPLIATYIVYILYSLRVNPCSFPAPPSPPLLRHPSFTYLPHFRTFCTPTSPSCICCPPPLSLCYVSPVAAIEDSEIGIDVCRLRLLV